MKPHTKNTLEAMARVGVLTGTLGALIGTAMSAQHIQTECTQVKTNTGYEMVCRDVMSDTYENNQFANGAIGFGIGLLIGAGIAGIAYRRLNSSEDTYQQ